MKTHPAGRCAVCMLLLTLLLPLYAHAENTAMPAWQYPLSPETVADRRQYLTLTNQSDLLDPAYEPADLVDITARCAVKGQLRKDAEAALNLLFDAAEKDGCTLYVKSSYRSYRTQKTMYYNRLEKVGRDDGYVAYPGSSDHQTGLGVDVLNREWTKKDGMNADFKNTREAQWMAEHCWEYGFIIRYMEDKEASTGIRFEPWHLRYVGLDAALYIRDMHFSLEEFSEDLRSYLAAWENAGGDLERLLSERAKPNEIRVLGISEDGEQELCFYYAEEED